MAEFRILTGRGDHADAAARAYGRPGEDHIGAIAQRQFAAQRIDMFIHHGGFTGQNRLFHA